MSKRKEGTSSGFILYLGYRLDKRQAAPALTRNRWSLDEMDSDPEEVDNEKDIEVREEVETRGIHGKVSVLCEVTLLLLKFNVNVWKKENKDLRKSVDQLEAGRRLLEERVEKLESWTRRPDRD